MTKNGEANSLFRHLPSQLFSEKFTGYLLVTIKNRTNEARNILSWLFNPLKKIINKRKKTAGDNSQQHSSEEHPSYDDASSPSHPGFNLLTLTETDSFEAEQFKIVRTQLLFPTSDNPPRSIMVTSAISKEGKSFIAANLAISIAQAKDRYAFLMDCDMEHPTIHKIFGYETHLPGLSEYLSDDIPLASLLLNTDIDGLTILPAGTPPPNPSELLSSAKMSELLKEVKEKYSDRYIIIDSPPPLLMAGTTVIARQVDGIIIVVKYGDTPQELVHDLIDIVGTEKVIGLLLNDSTYRGHGRKGKYGKLHAKSKKDRHS